MGNTNISGDHVPLKEHGSFESQENINTIPVLLHSMNSVYGSNKLGKFNVPLESTYVSIFSISI
jgi:hypothetical protein